MYAASIRRAVAHCGRWQSGTIPLVGILLVLMIPARAQPVLANEISFQTERCFAVANEPGPLDIFFEVDLLTGAATEIGPLKSTSEVEAIAFIPTPGGAELYGANAGQFGRIILNAGSSGTSVLFEPIGSGFGNGHGTDGNVFFDDVDGLAYDVFSGVMYGVQRRKGGNSDLLFMIDVNTGRLIRDTFFIDGELRDYAEIDTLGELHDIDDIAIDPRFGRMFGVINNDGRSGTLVEIDATTGHLLQSYPAADLTGQIVDDIEGLSFAGNGVLYGSTGENGPDNGDANRLFSLGVDTTTNIAIATEVSQFPDGLEDVEALGCLTEISAPPAIDLEKATNGEDADTPPGPLLAAGDDVTWTYVVVNTGEVALENITVTDNQLPPGAVSCPQTTLDIGATMTCTATGTAAPGQYANMGTVTATAVDSGEPVSDNDPSHYVGIQADIDIEKATNGVDADTPDAAPAIVVGEPVTWTYVLQNTGNTWLADVTVNDSVLGPISCLEGEIPTLAPDETFTCTTTGTAESGPYMNVGETTGTPVRPNGEPIVYQDGTPAPNPTDSDPSHYVGMLPAIDIEKATNGADADVPTGPQIVVGGPVNWTYVVTNTGDIALGNVQVVDDQLDAISCPQETLAIGASMTCTTTGTATAGQYANLGTVVGYSTPGNIRVEDSDPSHYFGILPSIDITKTVEASWSYVISNTGEGDFDRLRVDGGPDVTVTCPQSTLAEGESIVCQADGPQERFANTALVTAYPVGASTPMTVEVAATPLHTLELRMKINGQIVDPFQPLLVPTGSPLNWTLHITNSSGLDLVDLNAILFELPTSGGTTATCPQSTLAAGASLVCSGSSTATAGVQWLVGSATARVNDTGDHVSVNTPGRYRGYAPATVGGRVFIDRLERDGEPNGLQDASEPGFTHPGFTVQLYRYDDTLVGSTGVAADGSYRFDGLTPGDYYLVFGRPIVADGAVGFPWTKPNAGHESLDSDPVPDWVSDADLARTHFFRLEPGQQDFRWDLGISQIQLGGLVWIDENQNGLRDPDEPGFEGATVQLIDDGGGIVTTATTHADGTYAFTPVDPGAYSLNFVLPDGFTSRVIGGPPTGAQQTVDLSIYPFTGTIFIPLASR